jgi:hypothetical protein
MGGEFMNDIKATGGAVFGLLIAVAALLILLLA